MNFRRIILSILVGAGLLAPVAADAHPHVWVTAQSEIVYGADGTIVGVRHAWTFDEMFSTYALQGLETKTKGVYTREELAPLAETNVTSLKEFGFFTIANADGKKETFADPKDYYLEHKNNALVLHFMLPLKQPVKAKAVELEVYDPTYFVDFQFAEENAVKLDSAPKACTAKVQKPSDNSASKQKLSEQMFASGDNSNYGAIYSSKIVVTCS